MGVRNHLWNAPVGGFARMPFASTSPGSEPLLLNRELLAHGRDPCIAAKLGAASTPANRATAHVAFQELNLSAFGNRLPRISVFRSLADPDTSKVRADGMDDNQRKDEPVRRYPRAGIACGCRLGRHHGSPFNRVFGMEMEVVNKACYGNITQMAGVLHGWPPARVTTLIGIRPIAISETPGLPSGLFSRELQEGNPKDVVMLLASPVPGVGIRWTLGARRFPLVQECLRLLDVQMAPLNTQEDAFDGKTR